MSSFKKLNTRNGSNAGTRVLLQDPDGKPTQDWIHVLGMDSDIFQRATRRMRINIMAYLEEKGLESKATDEYAEFTAVEQRKLQASLVTSWSFDEPCTAENVIELLTNAPYIGTQLDDAASKRSQFASV